VALAQVVRLEGSIAGTTRKGSKVVTITGGRVRIVVKDGEKNTGRCFEYDACEVFPKANSLRVNFTPRVDNCKPSVLSLDEKATVFYQKMLKILTGGLLQTRIFTASKAARVETEGEGGGDDGVSGDEEEDGGEDDEEEEDKEEDEDGGHTVHRRDLLERLPRAT
jgi:hypothetical protein